MHQGKKFRLQKCQTDFKTWSHLGTKYCVFIYSIRNGHIMIQHKRLTTIWEYILESWNVIFKAASCEVRNWVDWVNISLLWSIESPPICHHFTNGGWSSQFSGSNTPTQVFGFDCVTLGNIIHLLSALLDWIQCFFAQPRCWRFPNFGVLFWCWRGFVCLIHIWTFIINIV